jgi:hypothetical protein
MGKSDTPTPDKHQPHAFEPAPEVPIVYPRTGIMLQQGLPAEGMGLPSASRSKCALCGDSREAQIHIRGEEEADAESPNWG